MRRRWIYAVAKRLACTHSVKYTPVYATRKRLPYWQTRSLRNDCSSGLRAQVSTQGHHRASLRCTQSLMGGYVHRVRMRIARGRMGARSCTSACRFSAKGIDLEASQFAQGSVGLPSSTSQVSRGDFETMGSTLLEPKLLCRIVWRCSARNRQTLRGSATRNRRFLPGLKAVVSAPETDEHLPGRSTRTAPTRG